MAGGESKYWPNKRLIKWIPMSNGGGRGDGGGGEPEGENKCISVSWIRDVVENWF